MRNPRMRSPRQRLRSFHINRMIPNTLTLLALAAGLSSLRFALNERWDMAVLAIVVAGILDGLDGRIARILNGATRFGAELDSLSDFLCFGVAPAIILYLWALSEAGRLGWALVLMFCIGCALRLARFNADIDEPEPPPWHRNFFVGLPSPAGAGLALLPIMLWFQVDLTFLRSPLFVGVVMVVVAALLVSRVRTFSFKKVRIPHRLVLPTMLAIGIYLAFLVSAPWLTLTLTGIAYALSIPFSDRTFRSLKEAHSRTAFAATGEGEGAEGSGP